MIKKILLILLFFSPVLLTAQETQENNWDEQIQNRNSIWLQAGAGISDVQLQNKYKLSDLIYVNAGLHYIHYKYKGAIGIDALGTDCHSVESLWATIGYTESAKYIDLIVNTGLSYTKRTYNTETIEYGTITKNHKPGAIVKIQLLLHHSWGPGAGLELTGNYNPNASYGNICFNIALGYFR